MARLHSSVPAFSLMFSLLAATALISGLISGVALGDEILEIHDTSLTTYIPTAKSGI